MLIIVTSEGLFFISTNYFTAGNREMKLTNNRRSYKMLFYRINLVFSILLFLITMINRNDIVYELINNVKQARLILIIWNWVMLISLSLCFLQSLLLMDQNRKVYYFLSAFSMILLLFTALGMFIMPKGTI